MVPRRALLSAALFAPLPASTQTAEAKLVALHAAWREREAALGAADDALAKAEADARKAGADADAFPALIAARRAQDRLDEERVRIAQAIALTPAQGQAGLALKMALWRAESASDVTGALDQIEDAYAFSVYRDLLRLSGLSALGHAHDGDTLAFLRNGFLSSAGED